MGLGWGNKSSFQISSSDLRKHSNRVSRNAIVWEEFGLYFFGFEHDSREWKHKSHFHRILTGNTQTSTKSQNENRSPLPMRE